MCTRSSDPSVTLLGTSGRASRAVEFHTQYPLLGFVCLRRYTNVEQKADPFGIYIQYSLDQCVLSQWGQSVDSAGQLVPLRLTAANGEALFVISPTQYADGCLPV